MIQRPSVLYSKLFAAPEDRERNEYLLRSGHSSLDAVLENAKQLQKQVSSADKAKLGEYFDSLREVETRMAKQIEKIDDPVPETQYKLPNYDPVAPTLQLEAETLMYDLMALALETDSTNVISLFIEVASAKFSPSMGRHFKPDTTPFPPRQRSRRHCRPDQGGDRAHEVFQRRPEPPEKEDGCRGQTFARQHHRLARDWHGRRKPPRQQQPTNPCRRRRFPTRPTPCHRPQSQGRTAARRPLYHFDATTRNGEGHFSNAYGT